MKSSIIFENEGHKWVAIGRDPEKPQEVIDTNEYIIISEGKAILLDPGGTAIFPQVLTELTRYISTEDIKIIVASHQDPDIASSLAMWLDLCPDVKVYCSWLWTGFISHFGMGTSLSLNVIPDEGMELNLDQTKQNFYLIPAHYCHSPGNFSLYDPTADILFSGDIGAALLPGHESALFVENFEKHIQYMDKFHIRWMPSQEALRAWVRRVRMINPSMIVPQHGAIFAGKNAEYLLNWLDNLDVGKWDFDNSESNLNHAAWMRWKK